MLLQKASGGRALQGVYLTKKLEDQLQVRDQLLEVPQAVLLTGAAKSTSDIIRHFSSTHQENEYRKTVNILGLSTVLEPSIPVYNYYYAGYTIAMDASISHRRETQEETYSSTIILYFSTQQVASYMFKSIVTFFLKYGSHANRFGGNYILKCSSKGFKNSETDSVKKMYSWSFIC